MNFLTKTLVFLFATISIKGAFADVGLQSNREYLGDNYEFDNWATDLAQLDINMNGNNFLRTEFEGACYSNFFQYDASSFVIEKADGYKSPERLFAYLDLRSFAHFSGPITKLQADIVSERVLSASSINVNLESGDDHLLKELTKPFDNSQAMTYLQFATGRVRGTSTPVLLVTAMRSLHTATMREFLNGNPLNRALLCVFKKK